MTLPRLRIAVRGVLVGVLVAAGLAVSAQTPQTSGRDTSAASVAAYGLSQQMPVDPEVLVGTLPNGLRYYVRANGRPARRAELRLVVKAGSVLEDDDQQGLAHFVEHMEFEGTTHFPAAGRHRFPLVARPEHRPGRERGDELRRHAVHAARADRRARRARSRAAGARGLGAGRPLRSERHRPRARHRAVGVADAPRRGRADAGQDPRAQLAGSRYADRPPIGDPDVIQNAQREQLVRFYHDWYRPDLMAVIVVGDVDRDAVAAMIKAHFSSLTPPSPERPRPAFDVPDHAGTRYAVVTDKETTATAVEISDLRPARNQGSVGGYRDIMLDQLFGDMLGARLDELSQGANPPFLRAGADRRLFPTPRTQRRSDRSRRWCRPTAWRAASTRSSPSSQRVVAVRLHRERARSREAGDDARLRADRRPRAPTASRRAAPTSTRGTSSRTKRCRRSGRSWRSTAGSSRAHAAGGQRARRGLVPGPQPARRRLRARGRRRRPADQAQLAAVVDTAAAKRLEPYVDVGGGADPHGHAAGARHDRERYRRSRPRGSPSGRCRTAPRSCSSRRR